MPETRFLATHTPHTTTLPRAQPFRGPGGGATAGSHVSASPAAGSMGQAHVDQARQALSGPPGGRSTSMPPQDARVVTFPRQGAASGAGSSVAHAGGAILATNQRPRVELISRPAPAGQAQTQIPPGSGVPFSLEEMMLVGQLLHNFSKSATEAGDQESVTKAGAALAKLTTAVQIVLDAAARAQAVQPTAQPSFPAPTPTRIQVPAAPMSPPYQVPVQVPIADVQVTQPWPPTPAYTTAPAPAPSAPASSPTNAGDDLSRKFDQIRQAALGGDPAALRTLATILESTTAPAPAPAAVTVPVAQISDSTADVPSTPSAA
jgi:hypothetical protein